MQSVVTFDGGAGCPQNAVARGKGFLGSATEIYRLVGPKVGAIVAASVPAGVLLGGIEIVTASVLYAVLAEFNLVAATSLSSAVTFGMTPVIALFVFTILAALSRYASQTLPILSDYALTTRLREALVRSTLGGATERSVISVSETSHLLANVVPRVGEFVNGLATLAAALCLVLLVLFGLFRLSWQLTIIALAFGGALAMALFLLRRSYGKYVEQIHPFLRKFNMALIWATRNNHFLRVNGVNGSEAEALIDLSRKNMHAAKSYSLLFGLSSNIPAPAAIFVVVGVFWLNAQLAFVPVDGLVPLVYLLSRTGSGIAELSNAIARLQRNWPHVAELRTHVDEFFPQRNKSSPGVGGPDRLLPLEVKDLRFGREAALAHPVSLSAGAGDVVLVSGPSGRGKTTFVMTLIGLIAAMDGEISWGGMPVGDIDPKQLRRSLGYAGPEPYLIDFSVRANLLFGIEHDQIGITDVEFERALRLARADFVFHLQGGLSYELREAGEGISAGQKQRLALARCILRCPHILLLDEATSNIDEETERQIMDGLKEAFPDLLIIAVSHRASLRRYATVQIDL